MRSMFFKQKMRFENKFRTYKSTIVDWIVEICDICNSFNFVHLDDSSNKLFLAKIGVDTDKKRPSRVLMCGPSAYRPLLIPDFIVHSDEPAARAAIRLFGRKFGRHMAVGGKCTSASCSSPPDAHSFFGSLVGTTSLADLKVSASPGSWVGRWVGPRWQSVVCNSIGTLHPRLSSMLPKKAVLIVVFKL